MSSSLKLQKLRISLKAFESGLLQSFLSSGERNGRIRLREIDHLESVTMMQSLASSMVGDIGRESGSMSRGA